MAWSSLIGVNLRDDEYVVLAGAMNLLLTGWDTASEIQWVVSSPLCEVSSG